MSVWKQNLHKTTLLFNPFFCGVLFTTIRHPLSTQSFFWKALLLGTLHERWWGPCIFSFEFGCSFPWFPEVGISRDCWSIARKWSSRVIVLGELTFLSWLQTSAMAPPFSWSHQMWLPSDVLQSICKCLKIMAGQTCVKEAIFTLARYKSSPSSALHLQSCRFYFFVHQQQKIWEFKVLCLDFRSLISEEFLLQENCAGCSAGLGRYSNCSSSLREPISSCRAASHSEQMHRLPSFLSMYRASWPCWKRKQAWRQVCWWSVLERLECKHKGLILLLPWLVDARPNSTATPSFLPIHCCYQKARNARKVCRASACEICR